MFASLLLVAGTLAGGCTTQTAPPEIESTRQALTGTPVLTATAPNASTVVLSWSDVTEEEGFYIDRSTDGGRTFPDTPSSAAVGPNVVTWTDTGRSALTTYCYRVRAYQGTASSASNTSCVLTPKSYEAEGLSRTTSSATASVVSNAGASGGSLVSATVSATQGYVELTTTTPATGVYGTKIRYLATPDGGTFVVKVGGVIYGSTIDGHADSPTFREVYLGEAEITTANASRKLRFELTSAPPASKIQIDAITMLVAQFRYEGETSSAVTSSGDSQSNSNVSGASNGKVNVATLNAVGDFVRYTIAVGAPGSYSASLRIRKGSNRGKFRAWLDENTAVGSEVDGYASSNTLVVVPLGELTVAAAGTHTIKLQVTGKNASASSYGITVDRIDLRLTTGNGCSFFGDAIPDGTACDDASLCTQNDVCLAGACTGTSSVTCTASDQCHEAGVCNPTTGQCSSPVKPDGSACDDGNPCTQSDSCQTGTCTGTNPVTCTASDQCHEAGTCDPGTGQCSNPAKPDGSACSDGNACTQTDSCQAGACTGSNPVACTASDQCHAVGTCDPGTGQCSNPSKPDGYACNDGSACTRLDTCQVGICTGTDPVICNPSDQCHGPGICDQATGMCSNPVKPDGSACNDGNACTQTDSCQAGACSGANPVTCTASDQCHNAGTCDPGTGHCNDPAKPDGSACSDGNACTQTDSCQAGACSGANPVTCTASDQCHNAGTCDPGTGQCNNPAKPDGSACSDGNACTQTDACQAGACTGTNPVTCTASDQCHNAGTCDQATGQCSNPAKPDGSACSDGNACTQTDACQAGACAGANPVTCTAGDQCHDAGTCDQATGQCTNPAKPDNTACNDGNACTLNDFCQAGTCAGRDPVVCADWGPCYEPATCDPEYGNCRATAKADGTSCDDGNACTQADSCQFGTCAGSNPVTCTASDSCHEVGTCDQANGQCNNPPKIGACLRNSPKISAGAMHTCAVRADGSIACWGSNNKGQATPPAGAFKEVSAGEGVTCALKTDGTPQCWGDFGYPPGFPPGETFVQVSAGSRGACGLRPNGSVQCWGTQSGSSYRVHTQIAAGLYHGCGVLDDGTLDCWGEIDYGLSNPPAGTFVQVVAGDHRSCALRRDGTVACWGQDADQYTPPALTFDRLAAAGSSTCGLQSSGEIACWGAGSLASLTPPAGPFVNLTVGNYHACATRGDDSSVCWGAEYDRSDPRGATTLPVGQFQQVSTAMDSGCRLDVTGHVSCWGARPFAPPDSTFRQISVSQSKACGILTDGTGACWCGPDPYTCMVPTWAGPLAQVSVSDGNICWLTSDGAVICTSGWQPTPAGVYKQVSTSGPTICAVRTDGQAVCWGQDFYGNAVPPEGTWKQLSVGPIQSCGIKSDDTVVCWGDNSQNQGSAPAGSFTAVAVGALANCAIRTDGTIACWGRTMSSPNPPSPPPGPFLQLSVGMNYGYDGFCATSTSGQEWCWGEVARQPLACATEADGACISTDPVVCTVSDQCHTQGVFDPATRRCTNPAAPDGTSCSDNSACTQADTCQAGVCTGADPVVCEAPWNMCRSNTCDPKSGQCVEREKPDGTTCDDGSACTQTDTCQYGQCTGGNPVVCPTSNDPCTIAGCDPMSGQCQSSIQWNGTDCEDGNGCTLNDSCLNGVCTGGNPVVCEGQGDCNLAGTCNPASGQCSYPATSEGASCDDRNPCTQDDTCQAGTCNGSASGGTCQAPTTGALAAGHSHTCALRGDGSIVCWGSNYYGESTPPSGTFKQLSAGTSFTCALRTDGTPQCWGASFATGYVPQGTYTQLVSGDQQSCGLTASGQAECWGNTYYGWPPEPFTQLSLGWGHGCGLRADGSIYCWTTSWPPQSSPPGGAGYRKVAAGGAHDCAITADRNAVCWGETRGTPPAGPFVDIVAGYQHACGLRSNGTVACWGMTHGSPPPGAFVAITANSYHSCAMRGDGSVACWGQDDSGQSTVPGGTFSQVAAGTEVCNLAPDGSVSCWGRTYPSGQPTGSFVQVAGGIFAQCGIRTDGSLACWDYGVHGTSVPTVPSGTFTQVSVGEYSACAVKDDGTLQCWGDLIGGDSGMPTSNDFAEVAVGSYVACARRITGTVACWGFYSPGPSDSIFTQIAVGSQHVCGVTNGSIVCWGSNYQGETVPPIRNDFVQVAAQGTRTCGLTAQGAALCWGYSWGGDAYADSTLIGPLVQISVGNRSTCGLNASGQELCWGDVVRRPM
jgi:alpha-tubulin suppressor-like RCC1 family protein